jgi:hypothetical protein
MKNFMKKFTCPHCKKESISIWQKCFVGSISFTSCHECGADLSTPVLWNIVSLSPMIVLMVLNRPSLVPLSEQTTWIAFGITTLFAMALHTFVSPIVARTGNVEERI